MCSSDLDTTTLCSNEPSPRTSTDRPSTTTRFCGFVRPRMVISALSCKAGSRAASPKEFSEAPQLLNAPASQLDIADEAQLDSAACSKLERLIPLQELPMAVSQLLNCPHEAKVSAEFVSIPNHEEKLKGTV